MGKINLQIGLSPYGSRNAFLECLKGYTTPLSPRLLSATTFRWLSEVVGNASPSELTNTQQMSLVYAYRLTEDNHISLVSPPFLRGLFLFPSFR